MFPGKMDPRKMQRMMKRMGMKMDELENVQEVVIKLSNKDIIIKEPSVIATDAMGQKTYQISGTEVIVEKESEVKISDEDVELIVAQTNVSSEDARKVLEETKGDIAEAILKLQDASG